MTARTLWNSPVFLFLAGLCSTTLLLRVVLNRSSIDIERAQVDANDPPPELRAGIAPQRASAAEALVEDEKRGIYGGKGDKKHLGGFIKVDWWSFEPFLYGMMVNEMGATSVMDIGCGQASTLDHFHRNLGIKRVDLMCVEGSHDAIAKSLMPEVTVHHDYTLGSYRPNRYYDVAWTSEFLEHVAEGFVENWMTTLQNARYIFSTHAPPSRGGWNHVLLKTDDWWVDRFSQSGFRYLHEFTVSARKRCPLRSAHFKHCAKKELEERGTQGASRLACNPINGGKYMRGNSYFQFRGQVFVNEKLLGSDNWPDTLLRPTQLDQLDKTLDYEDLPFVRN